MSEPDHDEIDERFEEDYDEWGDEDEDWRYRDITCRYCEGTGHYMDDIEPCEYCDGTGEEWWLR